MKPDSQFQARYIRFHILLLVAFRNLFFKKLRTGLTILGVVIGIGAIVFLVSLGLGLQKVVTEQIVGSKSVKTIDVGSSKPKTIKLNQEALDKLARLPHVASVARTFSFPGKTTFQSSTAETVIYGADNAFLSLSTFKVIGGQFSRINDNDHAIINSSLLKTIGITDPAKVIGQKITLMVPKDSVSDVDKTSFFNKEVSIMAVVETGSGAEIFTSDHLFTSNGFQVYNQVKLVVDERESVAAVRRQIEAQGFITSSPVDTLEQINQVFSILNVLLAGFGGIGMVIAILGMFNTLTISLLERTKEIGLLVSLGARRRDIRRLFIVEALTLSLAGGLLGLLLAWLFGQGVNLFLVQLAQSKGVEGITGVFYIPVWLIGVIIGFTTLIGLIVVAYPARRAGRISPIDALRRE